MRGLTKIAKKITGNDVCIDRSKNKIVIECNTGEECNRLIDAISDHCNRNQIENWEMSRRKGGHILTLVKIEKRSPPPFYGWIP